MDAEHTQNTSPSGASGMWRAMAIAGGAGLLVLVVAFAPSLWHLTRSTPPAQTAGAPWQIEVAQSGALRVFGLDLPGTTLAQVAARWGDDVQVAVMARPNETGGLEAYVERHVAGGIQGRLVLTFQADAQDILHWRATLPGERLEAGTVRHGFDGASRAAAASAPLVGITFVAASSLDATIVATRFGAATERRTAAGGIEHWLYPATGLAITLDPQGRDLLQYVAPRDFERLLRAPLLAP